MKAPKVNSRFALSLPWGALYLSLAACGGTAQQTEAAPAQAAAPVAATPQKTPAQMKSEEAQAAAAAGDWKRAAELFADVVNLSPKDSTAIVNRGIALERSGDLKAATEA